MHKTVKSADVCILDAGFTSCLVALLLAKQGVRVTLVQPETTVCPELQSRLPICWPSLNDPPTRAVVAHTLEVAQFLNNFCRHGVEFFERTLSPMLSLKSKKISKVWRVGFEQHEKIELNNAVDLNLLEKNEHNERLFYESGYGLYLNNTDTLSALETALTQEPLITVLKKQIFKIEKPDDICVSTCEDGFKIASELVICNDFTVVKRLFPKFIDVLAPMSDIVFHTSLLNESKTTATIAARSSNGHAAGCLHATSTAIDLWLSGPRFLLPQSGANILLERDSLTDDLKKRLVSFHETHLLKEFSGVLPNLKAFATELNFSAFIDHDCWPCDELPVFGELGLAGRALGSAGWLATHLSAGSAVAQALTDFVLTGKNKRIHPLLDPRRLFIT